MSLQYSSPITVTPVEQLSDLPDAPFHLRNLDDTMQRMAFLIDDFIAPTIRDGHHSVVDGFTAQLQSTIKQLSQSVVDPSSKRHAKALLQQKHRAWSETLKDLKRAGISAHPRLDQLDNLRRRDWLFVQPFPESAAYDSVISVVLGGSTVEEKLVHMETHFVNLSQSMHQLRQAVQSPHNDLPLREFHRALGFVESTFGLGISGRGA